MYIGILLKALFVVAQQVKKSQGPSRRLITSIFMDSNKKPYKNDCTLLRGGKKSRVLDFRALLLQNYSHVWQILVFVIQYFFSLLNQSGSFIIMSFLLTCLMMCFLGRKTHVSITPGTPMVVLS